MATEFIKRAFPKEDLVDIAFTHEGGSLEGYTVINRTLVDSSRWSLRYEQVFSYEGKLYRTDYSKGATECQEESPYEYEPELVDCVEVVAMEVTVTQYNAVTV